MSWSPVRATRCRLIPPLSHLFSHPPNGKALENVMRHDARVAIHWRKEAGSVNIEQQLDKRTLLCEPQVVKMDPVVVFLEAKKLRKKDQKTLPNQTVETSDTNC